MDFSECPRVYSRWTHITHALTRLATRPLPTYAKILILLLIVGFALWGARYLLQHGFFQSLDEGKWSRRWTKRLVIGIMALLLICSPISVDLALYGIGRLAPSDSGASADAIVFVGRPHYFDQELRSIVAENLWRQERAPFIFASGAGIRPLQFLVERGVPETALKGELCSLTTNENAVFSALYLQPMGVKRIILITDPPHMLRSLRTFENQGFEVIAHATQLSDNLGYRDRFMLVIREYGGLMSYLLLGRFS